MSIRIRHAEDLADNRHGQRSGQVAHQVKGPIMRQRLDELRGNSLRGVTPALHDAMGEGRLHQSSHPSVRCTVLADDGIEQRVDAVSRRPRADEERLEDVARHGYVRRSVRGTQDGRAHLVVGREDLATPAANDGTGAQTVCEADHVVGGLEQAARITEE